MRRRLVKLPGTSGAWVDPRTVVSIRVEAESDTPLVVVHTSEGFAVAVTDITSADDLLRRTVKAVRRGR